MNSARFRLPIKNFRFQFSVFFGQLSVSVGLDFPCAAHASFLEHLSIHCQGFRRPFSEISTKSDAVPLSDPSRNRSDEERNAK
jgi:hypothetical protein